MAEGPGPELAEAGGGLNPAVEYLMCSADPAYLAHHYLTIDDTQGHGDGGGTMPFRLWPAQKRLMWSLVGDERTIILKSRQLGISWVICTYVLWLCLFHRNKLVLLFSQGEKEAKELLRRVKFMFQTLPPWLLERVPGALKGKDSATEYGWTNGSVIMSLPATRKAGRSFTASVCVMDEAAHCLLARDLYTAIAPTISEGGQLIVLSTAFGLGNWFHQTWTKAVSGANGFRSFFLPWWERPGRDAAWYARQVAEATDPERIHQEHPATPNEAFLASGRGRFPAEWIAAQAANVRPSLPRAEWPLALQGVRGLALYVRPRGKPCIIGADTSEGLAGGDPSDASCLDSATREELFALNGHYEPDEFGDTLALLSDVYKADVLVERNNHGHATLARLRAVNCPRVRRGLDKRPGWVTNKQTKPQIIDGLAAALRDGSIAIRTQAALDEMQVYAVLEGGKTGAPSGFHDDRVMSRAIALAGLEIVKKPVWKVS